MPGPVQLVVDTNLFHECHKLDRPDFPWQDIGDFDVIELIVPEAVQAELDRQKNDARPRVRRRALEAVSWLREMLRQRVDQRVLRENGPRVVLKTEVTQPSKARLDVLDLSIPDDRIVGEAAALAQTNPSADNQVAHA
jgi:hypothetical protein